MKIHLQIMNECHEYKGFCHSVSIHFVSLLSDRCYLGLMQYCTWYYTHTVGKSGESGKLLPGKFDQLEGIYDFSHKEIH